MAYTHLGAAASLTSKKRPAAPVRAAPAKKASTLVAKAPRGRRQIKPPPPALPKVSLAALSQKQILERLVQLLNRESKIREGVRELMLKAQQDTARCKTTSLALKAARRELAQLKLKHRGAPAPLAKASMAQATRKASEAARAAAGAAADLKAVKAGLVVWSKALKQAKIDVKDARSAARKKGAPATAIPASPSEKPEIAAADKQAEQVTAQVTKDVEEAVSTVVEETKAVVADAKEEAPEMLEELADSVKEATEPTQGAEAESNSAGGGGGSKLPLPMLAAGAVGLLLLLRR